MTASEMSTIEMFGFAVQVMIGVTTVMLMYRLWESNKPKAKK